MGAPRLPCQVLPAKLGNGQCYQTGKGCHPGSPRIGR